MKIIFLVIGVGDKKMGGELQDQKGKAKRLSSQSCAFYWTYFGIDLKTNL